MNAADTYKGESDAKKVARLMYWDQVRLAIPGTFMQRPHLVLASREGGDISVLLGMGVAPENIYAAEINSEAAAACAAKWPGVAVINADVRAVAEQMRGKWASAFLDFCGNFAEGVLEAAAAVVKALPLGAAFGIGVLKGREGASTGAPLNRRQRRSLSAYARTTAAAPPVKSALQHVAGEVGARAVVRANVAAVGSTDAGRYAAIRDAIYLRTAGRRALRKVRCIAYSSGASPMLICATLVSTVAEVDFVKTPAALPDVTVDKSAVPQLIRRAAVERDNAHLLLNVPKSTVAAWRAHATRGTYAQAVTT